MPLLPTIAHLDADAFFVAVEQARDPSLRGKKVAVGGRERGIVASASYEARACGVYTPMPTARALRVCPDLILISHGGFGRYAEVSRKMFDLCETLTPIVQRNSIDEGYLDLGPCGMQTATEVEAAARGLQEKIRAELHITVSFGLATNKLVAQIASKLQKPRGFVVVPPGTEREFLAPLGVGKLPGIGGKTEAMLAEEHGIRLVGDLLRRGEEELKLIFGNGWRDVLAMARGEDERAVETEHDDAKSYSQQETFAADISDFAEIERVAKRMVDELLPTVRADGKRARTLTVKVRYPDFSHASSAQSLATASDLEAAFYPLVRPLLRTAWRKRQPLRLVGVRLSSIEQEAAQMEMFAAGDEKRRRLAGVLDKLNEARGTGAVRRGHQLGGKG
jgi:DNA polymerase-4